MRTLPALMVLGLALTGCGGTGAVPAPQPSTTSSVPAPTVSVDTTPVSARSSTGEIVLTLSQPYDGAHVTMHFDVAGSSNSNEANTPWSLTDAAHRVVRQGFFTAAGWGDKLYPYRGTVSVAGLPAGRYTFTVRVDDPSDGEGKAVPQVHRTLVVG
jgi:hypothetical protein